MKSKVYYYGSLDDFEHMLPKKERAAFRRYFVEQYMKSLIVGR